MASFGVQFRVSVFSIIPSAWSLECGGVQGMSHSTYTWDEAPTYSAVCFLLSNSIALGRASITTTCMIQLVRGTGLEFLGVPQTLEPSSIQNLMVRNSMAPVANLSVVGGSRPRLGFQWQDFVYEFRAAAFSALSPTC